jgi:di/tricarboxylate transporter
MASHTSVVPSPQIVLTLAIAAGALVLFSWNKLRVDVVGLMVMLALILTGLVSPGEGISGFANEATLTVAAMFVLSAGLVRTGGIDVVGRLIARVAGTSELRLTLAAMAVALLASAFVNNTPVVVVMMPVVLGVARRIRMSPSRVLMPLSFASQLGGTLTLIGTSTNLLVAGLVVELGQPPLSLFEFTIPAFALALIGAAYMLTIGRWLIPVRAATSDLMASYELRDYLSALVVEADSPLAGHSLGESRFAAQYGLHVVGIERADLRVSSPDATTVIEPGDILLVRGKIVDLAAIQESAHLAIASARHAFGEESPEHAGVHLAEMIVPPKSSVVGQSLRTAGFRTRYGIPVLGLQRHGAALQDHLGDVRLEAGDILLVQGTTEQLTVLHESGDVALIGAVNIPARRLRKLGIAVTIMATVVALAAFNVLPILVAALLGVVAMFVSGCVTPEEAYKEVDWMVLVLLGSLIPLGLAMQNTGAAQFLADGVLGIARGLGPHGILVSLYILTSLLTSVISNNATVLVVTPIALATAASAGIAPMPLIVAVMIAASNSFMTPIGYQTNTFIYGPGGYRFSDFVRVGGLLNLLLVAAATVLIPMFFPF